MASKLDKMLGIARIAIRSYSWKGFTLQPAAAYGRDLDGNLFVSFGVKSSRFGLAEAKDRHIVVFRCVNETKKMPIVETKTIWGTHSKIIGRCPLVHEAGKYSAPWGYVWQWTQIPYESYLAQEIFSKINAYHAEMKRIGGI